VVVACTVSFLTSKSTQIVSCNIYLLSPNNTLATRVSQHHVLCSNNRSQCALHALLFTIVIHSYYLPFVRYTKIHANINSQPKRLTEGCSPLTFCRALFCGAVGVFTSGTELQAPPDPAGDLLPGVPAVLHKHISTVKCAACVVMTSAYGLHSPIYYVSTSQSDKI
jgi:hypothetical protein